MSKFTREFQWALADPPVFAILACVAIGLLVCLIDVVIGALS